MNDNRMKPLYFWFTSLLCACAGLSAEPLIGKLYLGIFLIVCGLGILFSFQASTETKKNLRNVFGWMMLIGLPIFFWKISLQQSTLPDLIKLFIILIIASCFIIENASTLSLVHFECIFITIFSACLPFIIHPRYQVALFGLGLFIIIVLLQITHIRFSSDNLASQYVITNVSMFRRFILSFVIALLIVGIGSLIFFIVPKYSFQLNFNSRGSSFVDFKLKPKSNLRLMLPYENGEKELSQSEVVPYVRSLFIKPEKDENLMSFELNKWKQPLIIKEKKKEKIFENSIKQGNNKKGLVSEGTDISQEDEKEIILSESLDNPNAKLKRQIKDLEKKIIKEKKLYNFLSFMGKDDPIQAGRAKEIAQQIKQDKLELSRLKNTLKLNQGQNTDVQTTEEKGSGESSSSSKGDGLEKNNEQGEGDGKEGKGSGAGESGEGTGSGDEGTGEGESGNTEGESREEASQGIGQDSDQDADESGEKKGEHDEEGQQDNTQSQEESSQSQSDDDKSGQTGSNPGADDAKQSDNNATEGDNIGKDKSDQLTDSNENNESSDSFQNESVFGSENESDQPNAQSNQFKDGEDNGADNKKTSTPDSSQNNGSEQEKVNDGKGDSEGAGGGTNPEGEGGEAQGSGSGGDKDGIQGEGDSSGSSGKGSGGDKGESGSGGAGGSDGQGDEAGAGGEGKGGGEAGSEGDGQTDGEASGSADYDGADGEGSGVGGVDRGGLSDGGVENPESSEDNKKENSVVKLIVSYLFKFEDKPLSSFSQSAARMARGNVPKKDSNSLANKEQKKQKKAKEHKKSKQKKQEDPSVIDPEPLVQAQEPAGSNNDFFWHLFVFFAVLFCGGICWAFLYFLFCVIRKIFRDLKLRYLLIFKLNRIIVYMYRNFLFVLKRIGLSSHEFLTAKEIGDIAARKYGLSKQAIESITNEFEKSRYSNHQLSKNNIISCINAYNQLKIDIMKDNTLLQKIKLKLDMLSIKNRRKS